MVGLRFYASKCTVENGGRSHLHSELSFLHPSVVDIIEFIHRPVYKNKSFLHTKYIEKGLSLGGIAALTFSSKDIIRRSLRSHGIPLREDTKVQRQRVRPPFGFKLYQRKQVPDPEQQKTVSLILSLREKGMSTPEIAGILTEMKIPTKQWKQKWHPEMVRRIVMRA